MVSGIFVRKAELPPIAFLGPSLCEARSAFPVCTSYDTMSCCPDHESGPLWYVLLPRTWPGEHLAGLVQEEPCCNWSFPDREIQNRS
jgi:hypothetical protein